MLDHVNWIRGLAATLIVFIHMADGLDFELDAQQVTLINLLAKSSTSIFVAISGFFFELNLGKYRYAPYLRTKFNNVIIPYVLISLPAIAIYLLKLKTEHIWLDMDAFYALPVVAQFFFMLGTGAHLGPLWFIPALALIYLCAPMLAYFSRLRMFPLIGLLGIGLFIVTERPEGNSNPFWAAVHFIPIYLLGMLFCQYRMTLQRPAYLYLFGPLLIALSLIAIYDKSFYGLQKTSLFCFLYVLLLTYQGWIKQQAWLANTLSLVGLYSFTVYFLHGYFAALLRLLDDHLHPEHFSTYLLLRSGMTLVTIALCIGITYCVKRITRQYSRVLIGS